MKKQLLFFLLCVCCLASTTFAQISTEKNGISYKGFFSDYLTAPDYMLKDNFNWGDFKRNLVPGAEIGYYRFLNKSFNLGVPLRLGITGLKEVGYDRKTFLSLDLDLIYKFNNGYLLKETACLAPFIYAGVGGRRIFRTDNKWDLETPIGGGLNWRWGENWNVQIQTEKSVSNILKRSSWLYMVGGMFTFGGMQDQDGDKVADDKDACPTVFGLEALMGCPDMDSDGIADSQDACPDVAGIQEFNGCPDKDGDKVIDQNDVCPDVAGLMELMGCPDGDSDGVADKDDNCPTSKGFAKFNGCPDSDNDGIQDSEDKCPNQAGVVAFKGCPDADGDGLQDSEDKCPNDKGPKDNNGCPYTDKDKDGILDKDDKCPDVVGVAKNNGCPEVVVVEKDSDNDGVLDKDDKCPNQAGTIANKGCPEIKVEDKKVLVEAMYIQFDNGKSAIRPESMATLDKVVEVLNKYPEYAMVINGHTDNTGNADANQRLSEARAKQCFEYLVQKGIKADRISHIGYGQTQPIDDNKTAEGRKRNRRVEFIPYIK